MLPDHARRFAGYNTWANGLLYDAVAELPEEDYRRDVGAFFGSLHGTLNHILVADLIWLARIGAETADIAPAPAALDAILFEALPDLRQARAAADQRILQYCSGLSGERLCEEVAYLRRGEPCRQALWEILAHFFNHQTHHRGQAHALLTRLGREAPALDLIYYLRQIG